MASGVEHAKVRYLRLTGRRCQSPPIRRTQHHKK